MIDYMKYDAGHVPRTARAEFPERRL